ncbi:DUF2971 domain-containing protein [Chryseobacterium gleum]|uniref:DUF2971 domain-containing protein n=1 Tax=Chryseobacterium gleum TaxID=250 RepID=UPI0031D8BA59
MIDKIYKYRPLSDFLFKELLYQEIYFASYDELNDPLDLFLRIDFSTEDIEAIEYLIYFVMKTQIYKCFEINDIPILNKQWLAVYNNKEERKKIINIVFDRLSLLVKTQSNIWCNDIINILEDILSKDLTFDSNSFKMEIDRLSKKFLKSSYVSCFSETNNNFLMWSHYSARHTGICLEFTLLNPMSFPYEVIHKKSMDREKYKNRISEREVKSHIYWDKLDKVSYQEEQPYINFYSFAPVFENEHDCDLLGLSKSWTHKYAFELQSLFSCKTRSWEYENEWRAIEVNFEKQRQPEERIKHYPIEALTAIYFGINTPQNVKNRIYKIFESKHAKITFYNAKLNGTNSIDFDYWNYEEEE